MSKIKKRFLIIPFLLVLFGGGCLGEEIARITITHVGPGDEGPTTQERVVPLTEGEEISLWSEIDMEYVEPMDLLIDVEVKNEGGEVVDQFSYDPREQNVTIKEVRKNINGNVSWRWGSAKNASFTPGMGGEYTFHIVLTADPQDNFVLNSGAVVFKK